MDFSGTIRFINNYSDGSERWEIPVKDPDGFSYVDGKPFITPIRIGQEDFLCTVRFTKRNGCWICAYLFEVNNSKTKIRLSEILLKNGFQKNERVILKLQNERNRIKLQKA